MFDGYWPVRAPLVMVDWAERAGPERCSIAATSRALAR